MENAALLRSVLISFARPALEDRPAGIPRESSVYQQSGSRSQRSPQEARERLRPSRSPASHPSESQLPTVPISDLRRNLETLPSPRLKVRACKFSDLAPLKLVAIAERRRLVSEPGQIRAGGNHPVPKPMQVHRLSRMRHSDTDFIPASITVGIVNAEYLRRV